MASVECMRCGTAAVDCAYVYTCHVPVVCCFSSVASIGVIRVGDMQQLHALYFAAEHRLTCGTAAAAFCQVLPALA
jgi:hypothetical protein